MTSNDETKMIRVLLADDRNLVRQSLHMLLERVSGIQVVGEARDGREAVELTAQLLPDIVLMDVDMPRLSGIEATRIIRSSNLPAQVLMLSMYSDRNVKQIAQESGAQGYVSKRADREELTQAIRALYASSRSSGSGERAGPQANIP